MKLIKPHPVNENEILDRTRSDLNRLTSQPTEQDLRPCRGCKVRCACKRKSLQCTCGCSSRCPEVPRQLSTEPDRYPIEPGVVPLVYGLNALRITQPFWSCEGHIRSDESIFRLPQVWFHADSITYPQLLLGLLDEMTIKRELKQSWMISLCSLDSDGISSSFKLTPGTDLKETQGKRLFADLQQDIVKIGNELGTRLRARARRELSKIA